MLLPSSFLRRLAPEERLATDGQRRVAACGLRSTWRPQGCLICILKSGGFHKNVHVPASRERYCSMSTTGWSSAATVTTGQGGDRGLRGALVPSSRCRWPAVLLWWRSSSLGSGLCQEWENEIQTGARCVPRPKSRPLRRVPGPGQHRPPSSGSLMSSCFSVCLMLSSHY